MAMSACAPEAGEMYNEACRLAGYDHTALGQIDLSRLPNPVVRKVIGECLKQVRVLFREFGMPNACMSRWRATSARAATIARDPPAGQERGTERDRHRDEYERWPSAR
jgi:CRISPR-associated endonuclease Csn1